MLAPRYRILVIWSLLWILLGCAAASPEPAESDPERFSLFVLGRAQDGGLPHFGCEKTCCAAARLAGRSETPACLGVHDRVSGALLLIEATPGVEAQVALLHQLSGVESRGRRPIDAVMLIRRSC